MRYELVYMRASITVPRLYPALASVLGSISNRVHEKHNEYVN